MKTHLRIAAGQCSDKGRKAVNQDFHAVAVPDEPLLGSKGVVAAMADGISSSAVSQVASETAVKCFLEDYYATAESWSVKTSAQRVLQATGSWLYAHTRNGPYRYSLDRGYVCTFSALVIKSGTAHIFHVGDARVYAVVGDTLEQLTDDHRLWVADDKSYLSRALGMQDVLEVDYRALPVDVGDAFVLATDGVYEFLAPRALAACIAHHRDDLDAAARAIVDAAIANGSDDNLTVQIVRVEELPAHAIGELQERAATLQFPPGLRPRMLFDGYEIVRELHHSSRSHLYLAVDAASGERVALKVPSVDRRDDAAYRERFLMEEWVARRVDNAHLLKPCAPTRARAYLCVATEYIDGQTLTQWMTDNPRPPLEPVRDIVAQIALGLNALHRLEMLHQDLRPDNVMIDVRGTVKIIDFGAVRVAGVLESGVDAEQPVLGTAQFTAPEYFLGDPVDQAADLFSLGVIAYRMLCGDLPFGTRVAHTTNRAAQHRLVYRPLRDSRPDIPSWVDEALRKAVHPCPHKRYDALSEFVHDLRRPNPAFVDRGRPPLMERDPLRFWKGLAGALFLLVLILLGSHPAIVN